MSVVAGVLSIVLPASGCAVNVALYVANGKPISLGAAVFCGFCALFTTALAARR